MDTLKAKAAKGFCDLFSITSKGCKNPWVTILLSETSVSTNVSPSTQSNAMLSFLSVPPAVEITVGTNWALDNNDTRRQRSSSRFFLILTALEAEIILVVLEQTGNRFRLFKKVDEK